MRAQTATILLSWGVALAVGCGGGGGTAEDTAGAPFDGSIFPDTGSSTPDALGADTGGTADTQVADTADAWVADTAPGDDVGPDAVDDAVDADATDVADVAEDAVDAADTAAADAADTSAGDTDVADAAGPAETWLTSLDVCWPDPLGCPRAFVISHGGDWSVTLSSDDAPYASEKAFHRAYDNGADGIKCDFRVASDGVAVVAHSSPIELWESLDCSGRKIEEMTSDEVAGCHLVPTLDQTFQKVGDVLDWARGKLTIMLTVKDQDFHAAIQTILAHDAAAYTFIEVRLGDLQTKVAALPDAEREAVYYNAELGSEADLPALLALDEPRVLMVELDSYDAQTWGATIADTLHPAGMRAFVQAQYELSEEAQRALFDLGFDVDMSYALVPGVAARQAVNTARGLSPP